MQAAQVYRLALDQLNTLQTTIFEYFLACMLQAYPQERPWLDVCPEYPYSAMNAALAPIDNL